MNAEKAFQRSCAAVFIVAGVAKLYTFVTPDRILFEPDPVFGIQLRLLLLIVGIVELAVAVTAFIPNKAALCRMLLVWWCTSLAIYRGGLWLMNAKKPCPCIGDLASAVGLTTTQADYALKAFLVFACTGAYMFFLSSLQMRGNLLAEQR